MDTPTPTDPQHLAGRFVVDFAAGRQTGLTAETIIEHLNDLEWDALGIYKIHRVDESGNLELVGVTDEDFDDVGGVFLTAADVRVARAGYERLIERARTAPPPCRVGLSMAKAGTASTRVYSVVLEAPAVCLDAIRDWVNRAQIEGMAMSAFGVAALADFAATTPDVILQDILAS